jgi:hypothetical protein
MFDGVYYVRTGDKISRPFKIGIITKVIFWSFILYTLWITYEFFRIMWIEDQIEKLRASTEAKYHVISQYDSALEQLEILNRNHNSASDVAELYRSMEGNNAKSDQQ